MTSAAGTVDAARLTTTTGTRVEGMARGTAMTAAMATVAVTAAIEIHALSYGF
jgi:hypothetical protein